MVQENAQALRPLIYEIRQDLKASNWYNEKKRSAFTGSLPPRRPRRLHKEWKCP
jgi:hypothetical protein